MRRAKESKLFSLNIWADKLNGKSSCKSIFKSKNINHFFSLLIYSLFIHTMFTSLKGQRTNFTTTYEFGCLTLRAGDSGGIASASFGAAEVGSVVKAVGQRHLSTRAANATHHHSVGTHLSRPIPCLLWKQDPWFTADIRVISTCPPPSTCCIYCGTDSYGSP